MLQCPIPTVTACYSGGTKLQLEHSENSLERSENSLGTKLQFVTVTGCYSS